MKATKVAEIQHRRQAAQRECIVGQSAPDGEPPLAAHLVTPRRFYLHHGIYVGESRVIHYTGFARGIRSGPVEETSLEHFARGRPIRVKSGEPSRFNGAEVVRRARSRLGERRYRIFTNNCEHFCEWCIRGCSRSRQVEFCWTTPRHCLVAARKALSVLLPVLNRVWRPWLHPSAGLQAREPSMAGFGVLPSADP